MTVINQDEGKTGKPSASVPLEAKTIVISRPKEKVIGPRLVCTTVSGESKIYPLNQSKLVIGRSVEADLNLLDPLVSRKHCVIEKRDNVFVVRNVSTTNPLLLNDQAISEKRLYAGDQMKIGSAALAFISDRPEDVKKLDTKMITQKKQSGVGFWIVASLLVIFTGYYGYFQAYTPLKIKWALKSVTRQIKGEKFISAQNTLKHLLDLDLSLEQTHQAMELLAQTALAITEQKYQEENLESAMDYLKAYLAEYGAGKQAEILWDRLDYYRLTLAQRLERNQKLQPALREYAAIKEDSIYFEEAHKAIRRLWLKHQQQNREDQTLAQLLKEADEHFKAKQYLKPVNQNAYVLYQAVLTLEPEHELALQRIDQMKAFYRENGENYYAKKNWPKALSYFERYYLIDTETKEVNNKMKICREKLADDRSKYAKTSLKKKSRGTSRNQQTEAERKEEIKRMLEESGTESSWIMKYLFEEQKDEKDADKPW
ncbi:MAG: FHA domain-containing protein [Desulfobacterales bacterium]|nr:MAG: FHA domain-containing protein [Desulfobacterales bacterium]